MTQVHAGSSNHQDHSSDQGHSSHPDLSSHGDHSGHSGPWGYSPEKDALIKRLHRIEGQVRGIEKMLAEDRYCIDILTQIAAIDTALQAVAFRILDDHVNHCVASALASGDEKVAAEKAKELLDAVHRFARTR